MFELKKNLLWVSSLFLITACTQSVRTNIVEQEIVQVEPTGLIRLNQIGFYPEGEKIAVVAADEEASSFYVLSANSSDTVFTGALGEQRTSPYSGKNTRIADFTELKKEGTYFISVPGTGVSYSFEIAPDVHREVAKGVIKGFYYIRASTELPEEFAGKWARPAGHPDTEVLVHASAASAQRPEGTKLSAPLGWYDAGDYNKYIVNSGITTGTLLSLYEDFPDFIKSLKLDIPEKNNQLPDLLDEVMWNLRWMMAMQDPEDGGVYHKLTTARFEGTVMPEDAVNTRYVVQKGTAATLNFAAVMAQASRVFRQYENQLPGFADSALNASEKAWNWAQKNPEVLYDQQDMNEKFDPDVTTGAYGDRDVSDEWGWAASELYITTGDKKYLNRIETNKEDGLSVPTWNKVRALGYYSLLRNSDKLTGAAPEKFAAIKEAVRMLAESLIEKTNENAYATVMGKSMKDFSWGSNAVAANQGIALIYAYKTTGNRKYLKHALSNLDYLLGRNATGYSFVTGFGDRTPMNPHHRPSVADNVEEPVPGLLAGGPNPGQQDKCNYPSKAADESFTDEYCSYASNEIAINWNAPLVYLAAAVEALQKDL